jgi:dipeptide/tripeptide permease
MSTTEKVGVDLPDEKPVPKTHPPAIWFFFWGEFAERSSYYGMRAILSLYLTGALHFAAKDAGQIYSGFKMACYFLPLLGGYLADRWLGRYWTIVGFSVPYVLGHFILGIPTDMAMLIALALLAGGSGVIKPNISSLLGQTYDQKRPGQESLRSAAFLWFYLSINIGALISQLALPAIRENYIYSHLTVEARMKADELIASGKAENIAELASPEVVQTAYAIAFQFPAWLMVASLAVFAAGKRFYALEKPEHHELTPEERRLRRQTLVRLFGIFALVIFFWLGYEHNDSLWVYFTRDYINLSVPWISQIPVVGEWIGDKIAPGGRIAPDQLQFLNALFVIILIPTFNLLYARFDPDGKVFTSMRKILAGFILTAAAIGIMAVAGYLTQGHTEVLPDGKEIATVKLSYWWPALAYIVLTFGEVLLYGTMLDLSYAAAPKSMKGFVTACFLLTNTLANFINVGWMPFYGGSLTDPIAKRGSLPPGQFFAITAGVTLIASVAFYFVGKQFEKPRDAVDLDADTPLE